MHVIDKMK